MPSTLTGGCLCGAIRYTIGAPVTALSSPSAPTDNRASCRRTGGRACGRLYRK